MAMAESVYFDDLRFMAADVVPRCTAEIDQRFPVGWHINLYLGGSLRFARDDAEAVVFSRPSLFWISSESHFRFGPVRRGEHWRHHWVTYQGSRAERIHRCGFERLDPRGYIAIDDHAPMTAAMCELVALVRSGEAERHGQGAVVLERILMLASQARARLDAEDPVLAAIHQVADAVRDEPSRAWDFKREAAACGVSYHHFRRAFRSQIGRAPYEHVQWSRLHHAAALLQDPAVSVAAAGEAMGYTDPIHFSKQFKRQHGLSPRAFRTALPG